VVNCEVSRGGVTGGVTGSVNNVSNVINAFRTLLAVLDS